SSGGGSGAASSGNVSSGSGGGSGIGSDGGGLGSSGAGDGGGTSDGAGSGAAADGGATSQEALKQAFAELRFGMFLHFGMNTFSNDAAKDLVDVVNYPPLFNPTKLDPGQWMDAAKSAGMKFAVLTTKHHDGFLLWDSATTTYDVGNPAVPPAGHVDVVKLFVDACRARGIMPGLYFSIQDRSVAGLHGTDGNPNAASWNATTLRMPQASIDYVKAQITELLTKYGHIPFFVTDGWSWSMGNTIMPMQEIRELVYSISPGTLYSEHQGQQIPWHDDVVYFEEPKGGAWAPVGNTLASWQSQKFGHAWFWTPPDVGYVGLSLMNITQTHLADLEPKYCNFAPDFGPNRQGLLEPAAVSLLGQVGQTWKPNLARAPLPAQPPHLDHLITAVGATATSSAAGSDPRNAIDGINDGGFTDHYTETVWQSAAGAPQAITLDLGGTYRNLEMLTYMPPQIAPQQLTKDASGRITGYVISYSVDGTTFNPVTLRSGYDGTWSWDPAVLAGWRWALFSPVQARYMRLEATSATGGTVKINEVDVGGSALTPIKM
ncbi:MAG: alpha-L-fucosidase, partial [Myxococcota bacterium]|nr:alpha-L-fucosidase [Myxococcota bacterium]